MLFFETGLNQVFCESKCSEISGYCQQFTDWVSRESSHLLSALVALGLSVLLALLCELVIFRLILKPLSRKTKTKLDDYILSEIKRPLYTIIIVAGLRIGAFLVEFPPRCNQAIDKIFHAAMWFVVVWLLLRLVSVLDTHLKKVMKSKASELDELLLSLLRRVLRSLVWIFAGIMIAQNVFDLNVTALLAGAGVAGLAVAFAAQNTIANIFGAIIILIDKPFSIGEFIQIGGSSGVVERVGLRSVSLRSLDGHLLTVPNRTIADGEIVNISRRPNIKYAFKLGLVYSTPPEKMKRAMEILHEILDGHPGFDMEKLPPRIFFTDFEDSAMSISVIVWFQTANFMEMQQWKNDINLQILDRFNAEGLSFAYPSQSIYIEKN